MQANVRASQPLSASFELCSSIQSRSGHAVRGIAPRKTLIAPRSRSEAIQVNAQLTYALKRVCATRSSMC